LQWLLGGFAEGRGDLAAAKQRYTAAYQIDPTQAGVLGALSRLAIRQHDAESARRFLRTLLLQSFDEKAAGITKAEVYLELGNLHRQAGENAEGAQHVRARPRNRSQERSAETGTCLDPEVSGRRGHRGAESAEVGRKGKGSGSEIRKPSRSCPSLRPLCSLW
jgi:hypothetical protein